MSRAGLEERRFGLQKGTENVLKGRNSHVRDASETHNETNETCSCAGVLGYEKEDVPECWVMRRKTW